MPDMTLTDLLARVARGEDSTTQFKVDVRNVESLASEMAAFANAEGGTIFIGVSDHGATPGLSREDVSRVNQLVTDDRDGCQFTATVHRQSSPSVPSRRPKGSAKMSVKTPVQDAQTGKTPVETPVENELSGKTPVKTANKLIVALQKNPAMTLADAASETGKSLRAVERACAKLIKNNQIRHIGPRKGGHWEVLK